MKTNMLASQRLLTPSMRWFYFRFRARSDTITRRRLKQYLEPFKDPDHLPHIKNLRIGTRALTFWPQRFTTDPDADSAFAASRRVEAPSRHRRASSPGMMEVGGLFSDFGAGRTASGPLRRVGGTAVAAMA
jgi:hypothetical protein